MWCIAQQGHFKGLYMRGAHFLVFLNLCKVIAWMLANKKRKEHHSRRGNDYKKEQSSGPCLWQQVGKYCKSSLTHCGENPVERAIIRSAIQWISQTHQCHLLHFSKCLMSFYINIKVLRFSCCIYNSLLFVEWWLIIKTSKSSSYINSHGRVSSCKILSVAPQQA